MFRRRSRALERFYFRMIREPGTGNGNGKWENEKWEPNRECGVRNVRIGSFFHICFLRLCLRNTILPLPFEAALFRLQTTRVVSYLCITWKPLKVLKMMESVTARFQKLVSTLVCKVKLKLLVVQLVKLMSTLKAVFCI